MRRRREGGFAVVKEDVMLIHTGQNEFIGLGNCELIVNLQTIDEASKERILAQLPALDAGAEYKSAIKTVDNKWIGSTISSEALAQRGGGDPFAQAEYKRK
jgi:hypothetical protein